MDKKEITYVGLILVVGGVMLSVDGLGSILAEFNTHDFWSDLERVFRTLGGVLLVLLGIYMCRNADQHGAHARLKETNCSERARA